jgi:hypothetical protein
VRDAWFRGDRFYVVKERTRMKDNSISEGRKVEEETRAQPWTSLGKGKRELIETGVKACK